MRTTKKDKPQRRKPAERIPEPLLMAPPPGWLPQEDVRKILLISRRALNDRIRAGKGPQRVRVVVDDQNTPVPYYNPDDVERIRQLQAPRPAVFAAGSGVAPRSEQLVPAGVGVMEIVQMIDQITRRAGELLESRLQIAPPAAAADRGAYLTVKAASERKGISQALLRRLMQQWLAEGNPDVIRDRGLKITEAALNAIDGATLRQVAKVAKASAT